MPGYNCPADFDGFDQEGPDACRCVHCGATTNLIQICDGEEVCADCLAEQSDFETDTQDERIHYAGAK